MYKMGDNDELQEGYETTITITRKPVVKESKPKPDEKKIEKFNFEDLDLIK